MERLDEIAAIIQEDSVTIRREWKQRVARSAKAKLLDQTTLEDSLPAFLDEICNILIFFNDNHEMPRQSSFAPVEHAMQRLELGFDLGQLILEYSTLRHVL